METQPRSTVPGGGGGGKIMSNRRRWRFNPYDRPEAATPPQQPKSPNWLSGVVPTSRKIASGAAKILTSVFISDSSSSESDEESVSDGDVNNDNGRDDNLNETNGLISEAERKHVIEQLILQETFSREECDMLVKIIYSRVPEHSSVDRVEMINSTLRPGGRVQNVTPDHAVMEAKKFVEEKKAGRSPQSDFGHGSSGLYSAMIKHTESEAGSPADMAKSYMQSRPPWASLSTGKFQLTLEEKLHSACEDSVPHLKERKYTTSGAWNMQDEIRRLRSKATEEMLRPLSSSALPRSGQDLVTIAIPGNKVNTLSSSVETKTLDRSAKLAAGEDSNKGISASDIREGIKETALQQNSEIQKANGVPPSPASLSEGVIMGENQRHNNVAASHEKTANDFPVEYRWELSSEVSVEVPSAHDPVNVESGSQHSHEELSQEQSENEGKHVVSVKPDDTGMNQQVKTPVRRQPKRQKKKAA